MTGPVSVRAGWAVWSKQRGSRDDYSVLAASAEPLSRSEVERVLAHFAPGNPPAETGGPSSLPWVMLSRVGVADKPYVGVSVQEATDYVDGTGRPVSRTRYVCVPYGDIAGEPVSYLGLHEAVHRATGLAETAAGEDNAQVTLAVPALDPAALAQDITGFGADFVAATAALLLSGPVTITGPDFPGWERRLRFLDAVAALLPYGYRAHYTASTWSDTGASAQRFRIVFARRAGDKSFAVPWGTVPDLKSAVAQAYHASLRRTVRPGGDRASGDTADLEALIGYLARQTGQGRFDEPGNAVMAIREFRPAGMIAEDIDARTAHPGVIRDAFSRNLDRQWSPGTARKALAALIKTADPEDKGIIATRLPGIGDEGVEELLPAVTAVCRRLALSGEGTELIRAYLRALREYRGDDTLLASLLSSTAPSSTAPSSALAPAALAPAAKSPAALAPADQAPGDGQLELAAALVADFAFADRAWYPQTRRALTGNPAVATALIAHLCAARGGPEVIDAIAWLEPDLARALRPFRVVLGGAVPGPSAGPSPELSAGLSGGLSVSAGGFSADGLSVSGEAVGPSASRETIGSFAGETVGPSGGTGGPFADGGTGGFSGSRETGGFSGGEAVGPEDLRDLGDHGGPAAIRYLLRVASTRENLRLVLPEAACWLCEESASGDGTGDGRSWQDAAMVLAPGDEAEAAWLDLLLLAAHADPKSLLTGKYATPGFARVLVTEWDRLTGALNERVRLGQAADELLTNSLIDYLRRSDWRTDPAKASVVDRLGEWLTAGGRRPLLAAEVRDVETALRGISPQATVAHIAETCTKACSGGMQAEQVAAALADSRAIASGERAADVLGHLHWMMVTDPRVSSAERREYTAEWEFRLAEMFAGGALGERVAREFATTAARTSMTELRHHLNMLNMAIENRTPGSPPVLDTADIITLNRWHIMLRRLIDDAASGSDDAASDAGYRRRAPRLKMWWETGGGPG